MAKLPWTPWHEVVALRDDLRSGELALHLFAADHYEVLMGSGKRPVCEDSQPQESRTLFASASTPAARCHGPPPR
jgi:hypothetical protein